MRDYTILWQGAKPATLLILLAFLRAGLAWPGRHQSSTAMLLPMYGELRNRADDSQSKASMRLGVLLNGTTCRRFGACGISATLP